MQEKPTEQWHEVSHLDDLWEGQMLAVEVEGNPVLLINLAGQVRAYENRCPHQEWPLDTGDLEETTLICSQHRWEFDASTGKGLNPKNCELTSFRCKVEDDGVILVSIA